MSDGIVKTICLDEHFKYIVFFYLRKANIRLRAKNNEPQSGNQH